MKKRKLCRICKGSKFKKVLDMGLNPLVNSLIEKKDLTGVEPVYPLEVVRCCDCSLVQLKNPIDSHQIYTAQDYLYFTGDMPTTSQYFQEFVEELEKMVDLKHDDLVVEIGSNDGTMLKFFHSLILGVDPSTNVVIRAMKNSVPTLSAPFNENNAKNILKEFGPAKVIGGANCIAHIDDLDGVMNGVKALLAEDGVFWVECNYWGGMIKNKNYSLVYHDHFSYFSLKNWVDYAGKFSLNVFDAYVTEAQGGSLRVFMSKKPLDKTGRVMSLVEEEEVLGTNTLKVAKQYEADCLEEAKKLHDLVSSLKEEGKKVAGYGAAAKGFSILKLAGINQNHIDYFVDDSPAKQGKYTPVDHIPVISREEAESSLPDYFFITAPNYAPQIIAKEQEFLKNGGKFILASGEIVG